MPRLLSGESSGISVQDDDGLIVLDDVDTGAKALCLLEQSEDIPEGLSLSFLFVFDLCSLQGEFILGLAWYE